MGVGLPEERKGGREALPEGKPEERKSGRGVLPQEWKGVREVCVQGQGLV
jgi:hypothetical protein